MRSSSFNSEHSSMEEFRRTNRFKLVKFSIYLASFQFALMILFLRFGVYAVRADASLAENGISAALGGGAGRSEAGQLMQSWTLQVLMQISPHLMSCCNAKFFR